MGRARWAPLLVWGLQCAAFSTRPPTRRARTPPAAMSLQESSALDGLPVVRKPPMPGVAARREPSHVERVDSSAFLDSPGPGSYEWYAALQHLLPRAPEAVFGGLSGLQSGAMVKVGSAAGAAGGCRAKTTAPCSTLTTAALCVGACAWDAGTCGERAAACEDVVGPAGCTGACAWAPSRSRLPTRTGGAGCSPEKRRS